MTCAGAVVLLAAALFSVGPMASAAKAQQNPAPVKAVHLIGFSGLEDNAKGNLSVENGHLHFVHGKANFEIEATAILDVVTGTDSKKAVGKTIGTISMAAPYGGGRFLSLFRKKIDTLTVQYRDADGGLHGASFTTAVGAGGGIRNELLAQGAHTAATEQPTAVPDPPTGPTSKEKKE